ncbi:RIP metalloprotease RseP [uncultured Sunxiuqinia sp.]|uniref:RIP metalloprotease RseP n=1 Tax=uncultured Sunxiuqinia sp. TaxID=1573825 RepID=UPI002AA7EA57|nr:RIP metalloprotease RseP [uncultured Sunxiuqinia sp.]
MEQVFIKAAQLILSLSILVVLHEFGHFAFARLFKTRVEKFYLFFDPWFALFKTKRGETEYGVGWLPLGGYVKISGMIDESMDKEAMQLPPQPHEFRSKKPYQRLLIMLGGVMMNFIFAFVIYIGVLYAWGEQFLPTENVTHGITVSETGHEIGLEDGDQILSVDGNYIDNFNKIIPTVILDNAKTIQVLRDGKQVEVEVTDDDLATLIKSSRVISPRGFFHVKVAEVEKGFPAEAAGLQKNDVFEGIDGKEFTYYDEFLNYIKAHKNEKIVLEVNRDGKSLTIPVTVPEDGITGFQAKPQEEAFSYLQFETIKYGFLESIPAGFTRGVDTVKDYLKQFKLIFSPKTKAYESLGGFIAIGNIFPGAWDWYSFWNMTAFLSIILAIMNLLPIPALDGGHVTFLLYEIVSGRKPGEKFMEYAQITGMVILLSLVLFANGNDIFKLINQYF